MPLGTDPGLFDVRCVPLPPRGVVLVVRANPTEPAGRFSRWEREIQIEVDESGECRVWVDGTEVPA